MKIAVCWDPIPYSSDGMYQHFGKTLLPSSSGQKRFFFACLFLTTVCELHKPHYGNQITHLLHSSQASLFLYSVLEHTTITLFL